MRTNDHQRMVASVKRDGVGFTRELKGKISLTLLELRLKILRFAILFSTSRMHSSNTSIFTRMFFGIVPSDGRFSDVIVDASRKTIFAEGTGPTAFSQRNSSRSIDVISDVSTDGENLASVDTRVTTEEMTGAKTRQVTTRRSSKNHGAVRTRPLTLIVSDSIAALFLTPETNQILTTRRCAGGWADRPERT